MSPHNPSSPCGRHFVFALLSVEVPVVVAAAETQKKKEKSDEIVKVVKDV